MKFSELESRKGMARPLDAKTRLLVDLAEKRRERGITLRQIEEETAVSNPTLSMVERGQTPSLATALKLAAFYELPVETIWALAN